VRESLEKRADSKPMVPVTVSNVDARQVPSSCGNPIRKRAGLLDRHEGIHQDGVPHAIDQCRGHRLKECLSDAGRFVTSHNRDARRHEHVPVQDTGLWCVPRCRGRLCRLSHFVPASWFRVSIAWTVLSNAFASTPLPMVPSTKPSTYPFTFLPSRITTASRSVFPSGRRVKV